MINRIKDLMQIKELLDEIKNKIESHDKIVSECESSYKNMHEETMQMMKQNQEILKKARDDVHELGRFRDEMKKELYEFQLFKKDMRETFIKKTDSGFKDVKQMLDKEAIELNLTKKKLDTKLNKIEALENEIARLTSVAKSIKSADFELVKYNNILKDHQKEKQELIRKIDNLERLVARMRRR